MPEISKITLPSGTTYDIKDAVAREAAAGTIKLRGGSIDPLTDGSSTKNIKIAKLTTAQPSDWTTDYNKYYEYDTTSKTYKPIDSLTTPTWEANKYYSAETLVAEQNDAVFYANKELVFDGDIWHEFGDMSGLGTLAYKNSASGTYTPAGTVSQPIFTGTETNVTISSQTSESGNYTPSGTVSTPTFSGTATTSTGNFTPAGSVNLTNSDVTATVSAADSGDATYTPAGTVSAPTISVSSAGSTTTVNSATAATVVTNMSTAEPSEQAATGAIVYYSVSNETLTLKQLVKTTGDSITTTPVTVKNGDASYSASTPTFTGTGARLVTGNISVPSSASFSGTSGEVSVTGTPTGTVSQPTFEGTKVALTGTTTAAGTVSQPTFAGTEATITVS